MTASVNPFTLIVEGIQSIMPGLLVAAAPLTERRLAFLRVVLRRLAE